MKNKLSDLNNHLFAQLERLSDEGLSVEDLEREVQRADAIVAVSDQIVKTARVTVRAAELYAEYGGVVEERLPAIEGKVQRSSIQ